MKKRTFLKTSALAMGTAFLPGCQFEAKGTEQLRTAHVGVGNMGFEDLKAIASHPQVKVTALCDVDTENLAKAKAMFPNAKTYRDYRVMSSELQNEIDAVVV